MGNILLIGVVLSSLLSGGAVGTMMMGQNTDMMQGEHLVMEPNEWVHMMDYEDSQRHLEKHCRYNSFEECERFYRDEGREDNENTRTASEDTIPKSLFQRFLERHPRAFPIVRTLLGL